MSGRFVRASKFRHVFGTSKRKESSYDNLRVSGNATDSNFIKVNSNYLAVIWDTVGSGGAFGVIPLSETGRLPTSIPLFRGHRGAVLDIDWNPFHDDVITSSSEDGKIFVWKVPENFTVKTEEDPEEIQDIAPLSQLAGHQRKVGHINFNPAAENILASASGDYSVKIWDLAAEKPKFTLDIGDMIQSLSWNMSGSLLATTSRDKKLRIWDSRQEKPAVVTNSHAGAKITRCLWLGDRDRVVTTGFSRMSKREFALWDTKSAEKPVNGFESIDSGTGTSIPFWDEDTKILYLCGRGDGNIRYMEYDNEKFEPLADYTSVDFQRGLAFMPKRGVNTHENEIARIYKTTGNTTVEPVSFIVPRRVEAFQEDIYPPTIGTEPAVSAQEWLEGKSGIPPKIDMANLYERQGSKEAVSAVKSQHTPTNSVTKEEKKEQPSVPAAQAAPTRMSSPPSTKEQATALSAAASKFADQNEEEDDAGNTEFDEKLQKEHDKTPKPSYPAHRDSTATSKPNTVESIKSLNPSDVISMVEEEPKAPTSTSMTSTDIADAVRLHIREEFLSLRTAITEQGDTISTQNALIDKLITEVAELKAKME